MSVRGLIRRHARDEAGASLIEYTVVISLFLLIFFAILDFGRLGFNWVMTEKAMQRAARIAVTRPAVCPGVPQTNLRSSGSSARYGSLCRTSGACQNAGVQTCVLSAAPINCANALTSTASEIWCTLQPILPSNATPQNIRVSYSFDGNLGFLGGPYTPMVEVGVVTAADTSIANSAEMRFEFITPLPGFAAMAAGSSTVIGSEDGNSNGLADIPFPDLSVSMPGEDLNQGNSG